ncbi:MAG TPA: helix-turn-helix domain-containing protein [Candidatus Limnocylindrales bacterium]|nr:helix-turn-helix domain-containing protein [Candidatus Limnocylindrales bacterium]
MTTGNQGLDALADAIAERVTARLMAERPQQRLMDVRESARYIGRSPAALRHLIAKGDVPTVRQDNRVYCDRVDLDAWIEKHKSVG